MNRKIYCIGFICFLLHTALSGQSLSDYIYISDIVFEGNKHTKNRILQRELEVQAGERYLMDDLDVLMARSEERLLNTGLFHIADITLSTDDGFEYTLIVTVQESWYLYPAPMLTFAENSLTDWFQGEGDLTMDRVNMGGRLYHYNLTGLGDYLKVGAQFGFQNRFDLTYRLPYVNKAQTIGFEVSGSYANQREVAYSTISDQNRYLKAGNKIFSQWRVGLKMLYRPALNTTHQVGISYQNYHINDSVAALNPNFFNLSRTGMKFFSLSYSFELDKRNRRPIADYGYRLRATFRKDGLGISDDLNQGSIEISADAYLPINKRFTGFVFPSVYFRFIRNAPSYFYNSLFSRSPDFRGYEKYDLNGMDFFHVKAGIRYLVFSNRVSLGKFMPAKKMRTMPIRLYLSVSAETGGIIDPHYGKYNNLDNRLLVGYGPAVHVLLYEHMLLSFQLNVNHRNESAFLINSKYNL